MSDLLSADSDLLDGRDESIVPGMMGMAGLMESERLSELGARGSSSWAEGVWVSTVRIVLAVIRTSGTGARWPSGISCGWPRNTAIVKHFTIYQ